MKNFVLGLCLFFVACFGFNINADEGFIGGRVNNNTSGTTVVIHGGGYGGQVLPPGSGIGGGVYPYYPRDVDGVFINGVWYKCSDAHQIDIYDGNPLPPGVPGPPNPPIVRYRYYMPYSPDLTPISFPSGGWNPSTQSPYPQFTPDIYAPTTFTTEALNFIQSFMPTEE